MAFRLGGWWRLWITASIALGLLVATFAYLSWPTVRSIAHSDVLTSMSTESLSVLGGGNVFNAFDEPNKFRDPDDFVLSMENGHELRFPRKTPKAQVKQVVDEYRDQLHDAVMKERWVALAKWWGIWLGASLLLLVSGLAVRWVYDGFKGQSKQ